MLCEVAPWVVCVWCGRGGCHGAGWVGGRWKGVASVGKVVIDRSANNFPFYVGEDKEPQDITPTKASHHSLG